MNIKAHLWLQTAAKNNISISIIVALYFSISTSNAASIPQFCAVDWYGRFTHIDPQLGQLPPIRNDLPSHFQELAWSPSGVLFAGRSGDLYTIDPNTGDTLHYLSITSDIRGMSFSPDGKLYVTAGISQMQQNLRIIDLMTGNYSSIGNLWGGGKTAQGLAFSPNGILYGITVADPVRYGYTLFTIDVDDAEVHIINSSFTSNANQAITFLSDGSLYALGNDQFVQMNPTTGVIINSTLYLAENEWRGLAVVPETSTLVLLSTGVFGLATYAWRRRK
jgi:hypothetical protein